MNDQRPEAEAARLHAAERAELIGDVVILQHAQRAHVRRRRAAARSPHRYFSRRRSSQRKNGAMSRTNGSSATRPAERRSGCRSCSQASGSGVGAAGVSAGPFCRTDAADAGGSRMARDRLPGERRCVAVADRSRSAACSAASSRICSTVRPTQFTYCAAGVTECARIQASRSPSCGEALAMREDLRAARRRRARRASASMASASDRRSRRGTPARSADSANVTPYWRQIGQRLVVAG